MNKNTNYRKYILEINVSIITFIIFFFILNCAAVNSKEKFQVECSSLFDSYSAGDEYLYFSKYEVPVEMISSHEDNPFINKYNQDENNTIHLVDPMLGCFCNYFTKIIYLDLSDNNIHDLSYLFENTRDGFSIDFLNVNQNYIKSLESLHKINYLKHFSASCNYIESLNGLENAENLLTLDLSYNSIRIIRKDSNIRLRNLTNLLLNGNKISNIDILFSLESIKNLEVRNNHIRRLRIEKSPESPAIPLSHLDLENNNISNLEGIEHMSNLIYINCIDSDFEFSIRDSI